MNLTKEMKTKIIDGFISDPENEIMQNIESMLKTSEDDLNSFTDDIYNEYVGKYAELIDQLPEYFFVFSPTLTIEGVADLQFHNERKIPPNLRIKLSNDEANELVELLAKVDKAKELKASFLGKLKDALTVIETKQEIIDSWPELTKYIPETEEEKIERQGTLTSLKEDISLIFFKSKDTVEPVVEDVVEDSIVIEGVVDKEKK